MGGGGISFLPMHASPKEVNLFLKYAIFSKRYLEFGCGGSTFLVAYMSLAHITSIESDRKFMNTLARNPVIKGNLHRLNFEYIDIGATTSWGMPKDSSGRDKYPLYSSSVFMQNLEKESFDTIFVDGRFRVACILQSILYSPQSTIIVHDFWDREEYHIVLDFLECIDRVDTLGIFRVRDCDRGRVLELYDEYKYITD